MPVEMFLKMEGVNGGSKNFSYKGWADVISWGWGMESNRGAAQADNEAKTSFKEISIHKRLGTDSTAIMSLYAQGKIVQYADLIIVPVVTKREAKQKYLSIRMEDVQVKSIVTGGSSSEEFFNEDIILLFNKVRFEFSVNPVVAGTDAPAGVTVDYKFGWDIPENKEW